MKRKHQRDYRFAASGERTRRRLCVRVSPGHRDERFRESSSFHRGTAIVSTIKFEEIYVKEQKAR
jgi:hypothetical protein